MENALNKYSISSKSIQAVVIRTLPNLEEKQTRVWSETNPPYITPNATRFLRESGIKHLLVDLPSVDREHDEGKLPTHREFWGEEQALDNVSTITELVYVPSHIEDGYYILNLQISPFDCDAAPSRPILIPQ